MINAILEFSLRQRVVVVTGTFLLLGVGLWSAFHLPIDAVPDITGVQVQINTEVPSLATEESERLVTRPIEIEMAGLPKVKEMRSLTKFGLSQVTLQFEDGTDIYLARQLVAERLQTVVDSLPPGVSPKIGPVSSGLGEILFYTISFKPDAFNVPETEQERLLLLNETQRYFVKPLLRTVRGVAEINEIGGYQRQFIIQPKPEVLKKIGMTFSEFADVIEANMENAGGGIINRSGEQITVRSVGRVSSVEDIKNLPLKFAADVRPLLVKDVAEVSIGSRFRTGAATLEGRETVIGTVMMLAGENSRDVAIRVKDRIREIQEQMPEGMQIQIEYDRSNLIEKTIRTVEKNLLEGAILVVVVLLGFLGNWRAALIVASAIPLSFLFALTGMRVGGVSGNLMSLGAVDFGLIIDGAVVMVENIITQLGIRQHKLGRALTAKERVQCVLAASQQVGSPMFFGVLIITIVYLPILSLTGIEGKMFQPMAITVMLALGGALVLALSLMPVLCSYLLTGKINEGDNAVIRLLKRLYRPILEKALRRRLFVVGGALAIFGFSLWLFTHLGAEFVPKLDEGSITAMLYKPVGMSLEESVKMDRLITQTLREKFPELTRIFTRIGTAEVATDPMPPNESDVYLFYKPLKEWPRTPGRPRNKAELIQQIEAAIQEINPDYTLFFAQPIEMRFNEMLEGIRAELGVKIFGNDFDVLEELADQVKAVLETIPGAAQVEFEREGRTPQLEVRVKRDELQRFNLQASAVNQVVETALAGRVVGSLAQGEKRFEAVVRLAEELRSDETRMRELPLRVGDNGIVPLGQVVEFTDVKVVEPIARDNGRRRAAIMINLSGRDVEGFVREAQAKIKQEVKLPEGYFIEFGGQFKNLQEARSRLAVVVPAALFLIFSLIFVAFGSLRQALLVFTGVPLAVTGGIFALWLRDMPFSITAGVGFIALSGVAVLNGLVMISYINRLREEGGALRDSVIEGSISRLRPVLITALVASLGFVPMAIATGPGAEVQRPLATVVIGGIISSTILTLILLPTLYMWVESLVKKEESPLPAGADS
ncbi:MAG: CusA/CzcA family heavy metal efflux RND transporter [Candidatus Methylacidiphilales bacterium]